VKRCFRKYLKVQRGFGQREDEEGLSNQYGNTGCIANTLKETVTSREETPDVVTQKA
jgi:hypothetical protein